MNDIKEITCLMPIFGRWPLVKDAIKCFLDQTYPNKKLIILNDAPKHPLNLSLPNVTVINKEERMENLGVKRRYLLNEADSEIVSHWDSDDLYLPTFLEELVKKLGKGITCVKSRSAWTVKGTSKRPRFFNKAISSNAFEGTMVFLKKRALELGNYTLKHSGQAYSLLRSFEEKEEVHKYRESPYPLYVYRWFSDFQHVSAKKDLIRDKKHPKPETYTIRDFEGIKFKELELINKYIAGEGKNGRINSN